MYIHRKDPLPRARVPTASMPALTPLRASCVDSIGSSLNLPYMLTEKSPAMNTPAADKPPVLVVDDEYGPRESIAFSLAGEFAVDTAERAREALAKLQAKPYAAIV